MIKKIINSCLYLLNLKIIDHTYFTNSQRLLKKYNFIRYLDVSNTINKDKIINIAHLSEAENSQDLMVIDQLNFKKKGFFVEFGAGDGQKFSNTYLLEKHFSWDGIIAEPCKYFHKKISENRNCIIDFRAITNITGQNVDFIESGNKHYSKIKNNFYDKKSYTVKTTSLMDLLKYHNCPKKFDYLSIDAEGKEEEIINSLDFNKYKPRIISIEHNYKNKKKKSIFDILKRNGYVNIYDDISDQDGWYVNNDE